MGEPFQSRMSLLCFLAVMLTALGLLAWMAEPFLLAVFAGQLLALASDPFHRWLVLRKVNRQAAAVVVTLALVLLIVVPVFLLGALAAKQGARLAQDLQQRDLLSVAGVERWLAAAPGFAEQAHAFGEDATQAVHAAAKAVGGAALDLLRALPEVILDSVIAIFSCFFLLLSGDRFIDQIAALLPLDSEVRESVVDAFKTTAALTLWASLATAAAHCLLVGLTFLILGVPAALFAAAATFVLAWIPLVGSTPVWISGGLYLLAQGAHGRLVALIVVAAIGAVIDHALRPIILRGRAKIPAMLALVAILGGLRVFGLFGVFLGPVLAAEVLTLLDLWPIVGRRYGLDLGEPRA